MHAAPAFQITVRDFSLWRLGVASVSFVALAGVLVWLPSAWVWNPAVASGVAIAALLLVAHTLLSLRRTQPFSLRWDTQLWHWGWADSRGEEPHAGQVFVACDAGFALLLRFVPEPSGTRVWPWQGAWLPIQRRGHAAQWHALRCTVYSPRPPDPAPPAAEL